MAMEMFRGKMTELNWFSLHKMCFCVDLKKITR